MVLKANYLAFLDRRSNFLVARAFRNRRLKLLLFTWLQKRVQAGRLEALCRHYAKIFHRKMVLQAFFGRWRKTARRQKAENRIQEYFGGNQRLKLLEKSLLGFRLGAQRSLLNRRCFLEVAWRFKLRWFTDMVNAFRTLRDPQQETKLKTRRQIPGYRKAEFSDCLQRWKNAYFNKKAIADRQVSIARKHKLTAFMRSWRSFVCLRRSFCQQLSRKPFLSVVVRRFLRGRVGWHRHSLIFRPLQEGFLRRIRLLVSRKHFLAKRIVQTRLRNYFRGFSKRLRKLKHDRVAQTSLRTRHITLLKNKHFQLWSRSQQRRKGISKLNQDLDQALKSRSLTTWVARFCRRVTQKELARVLHERLRLGLLKLFWRNLSSFNEKMTFIEGLSLRKSADADLKKAIFNRLKETYALAVSKRVAEARKIAVVSNQRKKWIKKQCLRALRKERKLQIALKIFKVKQKLWLWRRATGCFCWIRLRVAALRATFLRAKENVKTKTLRRCFGNLKKFQLLTSARKQKFAQVKKIAGRNTQNCCFLKWRKRYDRQSLLRVRFQNLGRLEELKGCEIFVEKLKIFRDKDLTIREKCKQAAKQRGWKAWRSWLEQHRLIRDQLKTIRKTYMTNRKTFWFDLWKIEFNKTKVSAVKATQFCKRKQVKKTRSFFGLWKRYSCIKKGLKRIQADRRNKTTRRVLVAWREWAKRRENRNRFGSELRTKSCQALRVKALRNWERAFLLKMHFEGLKRRTIKILLFGFCRDLVSLEMLSRLCLMGKVHANSHPRKLTSRDWSLFQKRNQFVAKRRLRIIKKLLRTWKNFLQAKNMAVETITARLSLVYRKDIEPVFLLLRELLQQHHQRLQLTERLGQSVSGAIKGSATRCLRSSFSTFWRNWRITQGSLGLEAVWPCLTASFNRRLCFQMLQHWTAKYRQAQNLFDLTHRAIRLFHIQRTFGKIRRIFFLEKMAQKICYRVGVRYEQALRLSWLSFLQESQRIHRFHKTFEAANNRIVLRQALLGLKTRVELTKSKTLSVTKTVEVVLARKHLKILKDKLDSTIAERRNIRNELQKRAWWRVWRASKQKRRKIFMDCIWRLQQLLVQRQIRSSFGLLTKIFRALCSLEEGSHRLSGAVLRIQQKHLFQANFDLKLEWWASEPILDDLQTAYQTEVGRLSGILARQKAERVLPGVFMALHDFASTEKLKNQLLEGQVAREVARRSNMFFLQHWKDQYASALRLKALVESTKRSIFLKSGRELLSHLLMLNCKARASQNIADIFIARQKAQTLVSLRQYLSKELRLLRHKTKVVLTTQYWVELKNCCRNSNRKDLETENSIFSSCRLGKMRRFWISLANHVTAQVSNQKQITCRMHQRTLRNIFLVLRKAVKSDLIRTT